MSKILKFAVIAAAAGLPATASVAQDAPAAPAAKYTEPEQDTVERAGLIFLLFNSGLSNKDVPTDEKNGLLSCVYSNNMRVISLDTGRLLSMNPQLDKNDQGVIYAAAATVCGARKPNVAPENDSAPTQR